MDNYIVMLVIPGTCVKSVKREIDFRVPVGSILRVVRQNGQKRVSTSLERKKNNR